MKLIIPVFLILCLPLRLQAQVQGSYKLRIMALKGPIPDEQFDNIRDLGVLQFEPANNGYTRIYLANYLGKSTALMVLKQVKKRGYTSAYLVKDDLTFEGPDGESLSYTLQLCAVNKLNMQQILNHPRMDPLLKNSLYIWKSGAFYRISLGLLAKEHPARLRQYQKVAYELGFSDCFVRQFRRSKDATRQPKRP